MFYLSPGGAPTAQTRGKTHLGRAFADNADMGLLKLLRKPAHSHGRLPGGIVQKEGAIDLATLQKLTSGEIRSRAHEIFFHRELLELPNPDLTGFREVGMFIDNPETGKFKVAILMNEEGSMILRQSWPDGITKYIGLPPS